MFPASFFGFHLRRGITLLRLTTSLFVRVGVQEAACIISLLTRHIAQRQQKQYQQNYRQYRVALCLFGLRACSQGDSSFLWRFALTGRTYLAVFAFLF
jgi:hypothetical protein